MEKKLVFYKMTTDSETQESFVFKTGLNIVYDEFIKFSLSPSDSNCYGGFFTKIEDVLKYIDYGENIREVTLPDKKTCILVQMNNEDNVKFAKTCQNTNCIFIEHGQFIKEVVSDNSFLQIFEKITEKDAHGKDVVKEKNIKEIKYSKEKNFILIKENNNNKWRANEFFLGDPMNLGHVETYKYLKRKGANIHGGFEIAFKEACEKNRLQVVKYLIEEEGIYVNTDNSFGLKWSCSLGHVEVATYLISKGAFINAENHYALIRACLNNHIAIVKLLVENGADVTVSDNAPLRYSSEKGYLDIVTYLLDHPKVNIHALDDYALRHAALNNHREIVEKLYSKGADIHAFNDCALRWSSPNGTPNDAHNFLSSKILNEKPGSKKN